MHITLRYWRFVAAFIAAAFAFTGFGALTAMAGTTGTITGTVVDASTGTPVANVKVSAASPSASATTTTDARGFYALQSLIPDTYTVSFQRESFEPATLTGITVQQDLTVTENIRLNKSLKTIASVTARGASSLVQPSVTTDVYTVSGQQLNAAAGGDNLHKTLYQYIQTVPGVTSAGFPAQPRIHGQSITDIGYEFDGIPIKDRITGFFTTNLSNIGISNIEVYTGGLSAGDAASGAGVINSVVKTGTYPAFGIASYGANIGVDQQSLTLEYGGATPNRKFSYYAALDRTNAINDYYFGQYTFPAIAIEGYNGPGPVKTTDIIGNFHYKPNDKNDFQFLIQNGLGDFIFDYLSKRAPGDPVNLTANPCPGNHVDPGGNSPTGNVGGTAPNGQTCPIGLFFGTPSNGGNIWHHYSGIGKLQWNHIINDHSFFALRFAENFNQYIFDQPVVEANLPQFENNADFQVSASCPPLPYTPGTPIQSSGVSGSGAVCAQQQNWFSTGYEGDRRSNMYLGALDYTNELNANNTLKFGIGDENDNNVADSYFTFYFNPDGSWPGINSISHYPTHIAYAYASISTRHGKLLLEPGMRFQRMLYSIPANPASTGIFNPTFAATYTMSPNNVLRGSYTDSTSFVGSQYVYRQSGSTYNPNHAPVGATQFSFNPTIIHSYDLQFEHQFSPSTTLKIGPWYNKSTNIFQLSRPVTGYKDAPLDTIPQFGPAIPSNGGIRKAFGFEMALNHVDNHDTGVSYWLSGTYDNFWTNITSSLTGSYSNTPLPANITANGKNLIRAFGNPLFSASLTMDLHKGNFSLLPLVYYETPSFYNVGVTSTCSVGTTNSTFVCTKLNGGVVVAPHISQNELQSNGYWKVNLTALMRMGERKDWIIGINGQNIFNNNNDLAPCTSTILPNDPQLGPGCGPFWSPSSGAVQGPLGTNQYQNYSQSPATFEVFVTKKFP
ncbi:MAG: TonB dependent receptor [Candidatus Eremiobacteraeota bacterium]|nr:TonB dependent receptor [Candidatus Eremiobacteraeota bacterium]